MMADSYFVVFCKLDTISSIHINDPIDGNDVRSFYGYGYRTWAEDCPAALLCTIVCLSSKKLPNSTSCFSDCPIESMPVASLSPTLRTCSRSVLATVGGIIHLVRAGTLLGTAERTYHTSHPCYAGEDDQSGFQYRNKRLSDSSITAYSHPLSLRALRDLDPSVPHVFESRATSPYVNLAIEHHLLTHSNPSTRILFTYTNRPCVVIGRNQNPWTECDLAAITRGTPDGRSVELIRRRSGGGTVFHDEGNLNYTVIVPSEGFERKTHVQMVVDALNASTHKHGQSVFRRWQEVKVNDRNDIVARLYNNAYRSRDAEVDWFKVSGTAFKLTRGRALHHGTLLHSSPYIDSIGVFLRSPGRAYITAKGVESVRSPVTNLWEVKTVKQRWYMTRTIQKIIQHKWMEMYAADPVNEVQVTIVGNHKPGEGLFPERNAGIVELRSDSWRWDQTPSFSFDSGVLKPPGQNVRLRFEVKGGRIVRLNTAAQLQASYERTLLEKEIREISAAGKWREALGVAGQQSSQRQNNLIELLERCFPPLESNDSTSKIVPLASSEPQSVTHLKDHQSGTETVSREKAPGSVEVERLGSNTVTDTRALPKEETGQTSASLQLTRLRKAGRAARQLHSRLATWQMQTQVLYRSTTVVDAANRPGKRATASHARILLSKRPFHETVIRNLANTTIRVNIQMLQLRDLISKMLAPTRHEVLRRVDSHQKVLDQLDDVSLDIRGASLELMRILTFSITGHKDKIEPPKVSPERLSNAQRILDATLQMINEDDRRM